MEQSYMNQEKEKNVVELVSNESVKCLCNFGLGSLLLVFNLAVDRMPRFASYWLKTRTIICKDVFCTAISKASRNCLCKIKVQFITYNSTLSLLSMCVSQTLGCKQQKLTLTDKAKPHKVILRSAGWETQRARPRGDLGYNVKNHSATGLLKNNHHCEGPTKTRGNNHYPRKHEAAPRPASSYCFPLQHCLTRIYPMAESWSTRRILATRETINLRFDSTLRMQDPTMESVSNTEKPIHKVMSNLGVGGRGVVGSKITQGQMLFPENGAEQLDIYMQKNQVKSIPAPTSVAQLVGHHLAK